MGAKKGRIGWLPKDWETRLLENARHNEANHGAGYATGIAVLWATGCRPSELAKGVKIRRNGNTWEFTIEGTKTGTTGGVAGAAKRGSALRVVKVKANGQAWSSCLLDAWVKGGGGWLTVKTASADTIATQIRRVARREWGDLPASRLPSPYSFRHSMGRDLKTQGEAPEVIARVLGHASCQSQKRYGKWRKGGGSKSPRKGIEAISSTAPRGGKAKADKSPLARFKAASAAKKRSTPSTFPRPRI